MTIKQDSRARQTANDQNVTIEVDLHEAQQAIFESEARFRVVAAGRRFGKTVLGSVECLIEAFNNPGAIIWWVAPVSDQAALAKRQLLKMLPKGLYHLNSTTKVFTLVNGSTIWLKSAERWDNLKGEGVDFLVVDEAAKVDEEAWTEALRATVADKLGRVLFISTFKGENWFFKLHAFAGNPENEDWEAFTFPTSHNPYFPPGELDAARRSMPYEKYMQEFECSPQLFVGAIFDGDLLAQAAERGKLVDPGSAETWVPPHRSVEAGIDWGWHVTAMEVCVETTDDRIQWIYEFVWEHVELNKRCARIAEICLALGVEVCYTDAAGASENVTLAVALAKAGLKTEVQPVPFNQYKTVGIDVRRYYLENALEDISPRCPGLLTDSKRYHYDQSGEKPAKGEDHTVDAATAFYASREDILQGIRERAMAEEAA